MIAKGLKKGEVFEDGGLYYEVQSVLPNGHYVSKRVDRPKEDTEKPVEEPAEEVKETVAEVAPTEDAVNATPKNTGGKKK